MNPELAPTFLSYMQRRPEGDEELGAWVDDGIAMLTDEEWALFEKAFQRRRKDPAACWALWGILGVFGGHRFFLGKSATAILYLFTLGMLGLGVLADLFNLGEIIRAYNTRVQADIVASLINVRLNELAQMAADAAQTSASV